MLARELDQLGHARHLAVVAHDLADDAGRLAPREARQIDRALGLTRADEHAAAPRAQREDVPGDDQIVGPRVARDRDADRLGPLARRDAGGRPVARVDAHREGGVVAGLVVGRHHRQPELRDALLGDRQADEPAPLPRHEVDRLGGDQIGGHRQVALVLAILVVDEDHHPAGADRLHRALDGGVPLARVARTGPQRTTPYLFKISTDIGRAGVCAAAPSRAA